MLRADHTSTTRHEIRLQPTPTSLSAHQRTAPLITHHH